MNITGLIAIILSIAGYIVTIRLFASRPTCKLIPLLIICSLASIPGIFFVIYYFHIIPEMKWFYEFRSVPGIELFTVFIGITGGICTIMLPKRFKYSVFVVVLLLSAMPYIKPLIFPLNHNLLHDTWKDGVCIQSTGSTCGPASAATVMKQLGINVTEHELARDSISSATGTEAWYLANALRKRNAKVQFIIASPSTIPEHMPCIAGVKLSGGIGHFIAILGRSGTKYQTADPMSGPANIEADKLKKRYEFTGFSMYIQKPQK